MEHQELITLVRELAYSGKRAQEIERELQRISGRYSDESIGIAWRKIDDFVIDFQLATQEKSKAFNQLLIGVLVLMAGVGVTGYTYFSGMRQYVLAYGAILGGAWIAKEGYKIYRQPIEKLVPRRRLFQR